ncbi:hypothetical protein KSS87_015961 [Heliosperma pusillum]|nr:hypothetical protein KSS87_015961 [Heliosperma pusillum]
MGGNKNKRKRGREEERSIHPRNKYAENPPDFSHLASIYPSFAHFVSYSHKNGRPRIDWTDFNATRELTRVLLLHDHSINWWIPDGQLCPTVPNRSNYIHWIEDLLASDIIEKNNVDGDKVRGFDIGTGANCIYPLLGASLLGWSFVGSDVTDVALEWADKNVKSNPHISDLIEIRRVKVTSPINEVPLELNSTETEGDDQRKELSQKMRETDDTAVSSSCDKFNDVELLDGEQTSEVIETKDNDTQPGLSIPISEQSDVDTSYCGPSILVGVVREGEKFDFCMCNPPFFESMAEAGLNPKTSCGGTTEEMACPGGERAFISRIIEDSVTLKQSFRWYTSMVGRKSNLKFLTSKLREVGVTIVKTTEFVQGQTCRWGIAWSFMTPAKRVLTANGCQKSQLSFMLEGLQRQSSAFSVLQSVESFFTRFGVSCKCNAASFTVDVRALKDHCDAILKSDAKNLDEVSSCKHMAEPSGTSSSDVNLSFRISVFQQIPGTLLLKGSLQQRDSPFSGASFVNSMACFAKTLRGFMQ